MPGEISHDVNSHPTPFCQLHLPQQYHTHWGNGKKTQTLQPAENPV